MGSATFAIGAYARSLRRPAEARMVAVLDHAMTARGYQLITMPSRAVRMGDIHEILLTGQACAAPGTVVDDVAVVGFAEFHQGGILVASDRVVIAGRAIGYIAGFDESHAPNHLNIVVVASHCATGLALGVQLEDEVRFAPE